MCTAQGEALHDAVPFGDEFLDRLRKIGERRSDRGRNLLEGLGPCYRRQLREMQLESVRQKLVRGGQVADVGDLLDETSNGGLVLLYSHSAPLCDDGPSLRGRPAHGTGRNVSLGTLTPTRPEPRHVTVRPAKA